MKQKDVDSALCTVYYIGIQAKANQAKNEASEVGKMKVLSIDAWAGAEVGCWEWNNWYTCGNIDKDVFEGLKTDQDYATWFYENGYTTSDDLSLCVIEDDEYNVTICDAADGRPLFAIEYGPEY